MEKLLLMENMESIHTVSQRDNVCPLLCVLRTSLFFVTVIFLVYLPLGDPVIHCQTVASTHNRRIAMCYMCETYFLAAKLVNKASDTLKCIVSLILDILYETKLKFYALLEKIDREDLRSTVCCKVNDEPSERMNQLTCPKCKCVRNRCRNKSDCRYVKR